MKPASLSQRLLSRIEDISFEIYRSHFFHLQIWKQYEHDLLDAVWSNRRE